VAPVSVEVTVVVPTHDPDEGRLRQALLGLREQTLTLERWETILVNNASRHFPDAAFFQNCAPLGLSILEEPQMGLTFARRRGLIAARGQVVVLVDDDNVLAPHYLERVLEHFHRHPHIGALGGKSQPGFSAPPPEWTQEFFGALALRDLGESPILSAGLRPPGAPQNQYPLCAPIGAGMALRRPAWNAWLESLADSTVLSDRRGGKLTSSGDNDIVFRTMEAGWEVAYFPDLVLTHLIPQERLSAGYLGRLNRGIQDSWMRVLSLHQANPWPPLSPSEAWLRKFRAWFRHRAWSSAAAWVRWQGACGHFEGRIAVAIKP